MWANGGRNIKLEKTEFIDMSPLNGGLGFNTEACTVKMYQKFV